MGKKKSKAGAISTARGGLSPEASPIDARVAIAKPPRPPLASLGERLSELHSTLAEVEAVCNASAHWAAEPHDCVSALDELAGRLAALQSLECAGPTSDAPGNESSPEEWDAFWQWVEAAANGKATTHARAYVFEFFWGNA
jgi:hypothetical protein